MNGEDKIMNSKLIYDKVDKFKFLYSNSKVVLPEDIRKSIEENWNNLMESGKEYTNDEIFTVSDIMFNDDTLEFIMKKTNFAHYMYTLKNNWEGEYICRSVAGSALMVTSDDFYVLCKMANYTSLGGKVKFIGGAISENDVYKDEIIPKKCVKREVLEEVGLDLNDKEKVNKTEHVYFITRKNLSFINTFFKVYLNMSSNELLLLFKEYDEYLKKNNLERELHSIVFVKKDKESVLNFIKENNCVEYLEDTFKAELGIEKPKQFFDEMKK